MSTFKKYLKLIDEGKNETSLAIIKESNVNHEKVTDTPDEIKKINDEKIIENFINSNVFIELSNDISTKMFTEIGKNGEIKDTFKTNAETFNVINKYIKENKEKFLKKLENKFIEILNVKGKKIVKEYDIKNINFEDIEKGKSPNSFSISLTFNSTGYQKTGKVIVKRGVGEEKGIIDKEPNRPYYKGAGPASDRGGEPYRVFPKKETKKPNESSSYTTGKSFREPGRAPDPGGVYKNPFNHVPGKRKKNK